jgi:outer membrane murein-binding lipoprotein Lpp
VLPQPLSLTQSLSCYSSTPLHPQIFARGSESHLYTSLILHQGCTSRAEAMVGQVQGMARKTQARQRRLAAEMQQLAAAGEAASYAYAEAISCR